MLEPSTQRILFTNLRPFFTWWVREQDDDRRHPFDKADAPQTKTTPVPLAQLDDVRAMLATCGKDFASRRDEAIIRVLIDTGVRRGELVGMALADWNRHHDLITVDGKSGERTVPVSLSTGEAMARYVRVRSTHTRANLPALWLGERGPLGKTGVAQILKRRCELAGIDPINPHKLRHTFSHLFRAEGGSEGDLMYLAGWTTTAMAHRYGASAASERAHDTARRIAEALLGAFGDDGSLTPRGGLAYGPVLSRAGDFFGATVNIAARLVDVAVPGEVLITDDLGQLVQRRLQPAGRRMLRGFDDPIAVWSLTL
jgi:integrase